MCNLKIHSDIFSSFQQRPQNFTETKGLMNMSVQFHKNMLRITGTNTYL